MASKFYSINKLYKDACKEISTDIESWQGFLLSAGRNFKLRFDEQVLVYAQRPDATAVLTIEKWNGLFRRWVNNGARGIAVFDDEFGENQRLKYYFDVSDTHEGTFSRPVPLWDYDNSYEDEVIETLEASFGELERKESIAGAVLSASENAARDNLSDYLEFLHERKAGSRIGTLDNDNIKICFEQLVSTSVAYMIMARLGIDINSSFEKADFAAITDFNTKDTLHAIGYAVSDISQMALSEIGKTIRNLQAEKKLNRTFAAPKEGIYNGEKRERRGEHEHRISTERELSDSNDRYAEGRANANRQIRTDEERLPERTSQIDFLQHADGLQLKRASEEHGQGGRGDAGTSDCADGEERGRERGIESSRHDELGSEDEQHQGQSDGSSKDGTDFQVKYFDRKAGESKLPFFCKDSDIHEILLSTPHLKASYSEIRKFFEMHDDTAERVAYLKEIFNNDYTELIISGERRVGYKTYQNVLHLWEGSYLSRTAEGYYNWEVISEHFDSLRILNKLYDIAEPLPSVEAQTAFFNSLDSVKETDFPQEVIDVAITKGSGFENGKYRIFEQFEKSLSQKENVEFLKKEYGTGGRNPIKSGLGIGEDHSPKGIMLSKGYGNDSPKILIKWQEVEKRIRELIRIGRYLNKKEAENYPAWLEKETIRIKAIEEYRKNKEILSIAPPEAKPEEQTQYGEYEFHLGDSVFIGAQQYEILAIDDEEVVLYDTACPLINKTMNRQEFDIRAAETPGNEHLRKEPGKESEKEEEEKEKEEKEEAVQVSESESLTPSWERSPEKKPAGYIFPEIKRADRIQYRISDDAYGEGSPKEKFRRNIEAIRLLKTLDEKGRFATEQEQEILAGYTGWGGQPEAFDESNSSWANEYIQLKQLLDEDEYAAARQSCLTAFYTPPVVIRVMYQVLRQSGFSEGNILEPSCGIGNFFGMLPEDFEKSKLYGVEADSVSGRIARQLYQNASISIEGYENTSLPDSFFDVAIGNIPFGDFRLADKRYDKENFLIHDYFFAKTIDKVRPGGIVAFVTSKGTLDKENPKVRKYIAQRADLIGAIRLPSNTFTKNAGTEVTSDIIFLQKRESIIDIEPEWLHLGLNDDGIQINQYYIQHPEMVLGKMEMVSGRFGQESSCIADESIPLSIQLDNAVKSIHAQITERTEELSEEEDEYIIADPSVKNFSFALIDGKIYFRENSIMKPVAITSTAESRIKGMIQIRDCLKMLITYQSEDYPEEEIAAEQKKLNQLYDSFTKKYGLISGRANSSAFSDDSSYFLLTALEILNDDGSLNRKADIFYKRTIRSHKPSTRVDTSVEALGVSIGEKARVDMAYMESLCMKTEAEIFEELKGIIFLNPNWKEESSEEKYLTADEYLSGNVREKLETAKLAASARGDDFTENVNALEKAQPKDLPASEISVRLGATWIPERYIEQFTYELLGTPFYLKDRIRIHLSKYTGEWYVENKSMDSGNVKANRTFGTARINEYKIIEQTLNLKAVRIFDYNYESDGKKTAVLNKKETAIAQAKQEQIKQAFTDWIWKDPDRRNRLCRIYNDKFNAIRPREYDGSHIVFEGMNPEISLMTHQKNAVARVLYGGNTLLAHCVGAGKTFEMTAAAMESKRLGLCSKSLFVVPNHLINQWASEFLQLYPAANLLVATKKDFEKKNRKRFCSRIATGDYDSIIIGHSQFEKIPMSMQRQVTHLENEIESVTRGIKELKAQRGERLSVKALEKMKKGLETKLKKLNDQSRKDDVVTFEELGVDRIFIDEAHYYKNLFLYTKMRNVGGIAQTEAQKSTDLYMKCRYLDELTGGKGVVFATGTPISNSMVELYTLQRYLEYDRLREMGLETFDAWASTFGETVTAIELAPEGTGYRAKTRFARFYNLPELMAMFKEIADIQTADMLNLPVPEAEYINVSVKPSEMQKEMVQGLAERAEKIRNKQVSSNQDNMLKVTNDGRKLALDQRLLNPMLPDFEGSKVNECVKRVYDIWKSGKARKLTQLLFCDLSTPKNDGSFDVYNDIKDKLTERGIPKEEIAFVHDADNDAKKAKLFSKVRAGEVRILIGSTQKMGAGTNVQRLLAALHDLDCPWRPSDLEQRSGRIIRQGNSNEKVTITRYVTEGTFDAYLYQILETKQRFISQIYTSKSPVRSAEDVDEVALSYAEMKMLASDNPYIKEKMDLDIQVSKLKMLKQSFLSEKYDLEDRLLRVYPQVVKNCQEKISGYEKDNAMLQSLPESEDKFTGMMIGEHTYDEKKTAGDALLLECKKMKSPEAVKIGEYKGFSMELGFDMLERDYILTLRGSMSYSITLGADTLGNLTRIENALERIPELLKKTTIELEETRRQMENAREEVAREYPHEEELHEKSRRLDELNILLNMDKKDVAEIDDSPEVETDEATYKREERQI